jgi:hypothetical protein
MAGPEHEFQDIFVDKLRAWGARVTPLAASRYMAGQPDLLINTTEGYTYYIENKVWKNVMAPMKKDMWDLLHGPQIGGMHALWKMNVVAPIFAQDLTEPDFVYVSYKDWMCRIAWRPACNFLARAKDNRIILNSLFGTVV